LVLKKKSARRADPQQRAATAVTDSVTKGNPSIISLKSNPSFSKQKQLNGQLEDQCESPAEGWA